MTQLQISSDLALPLDLVVEATAVVGKRGRGKTFTAKRLVEEVLRAGVTVLVIDPTDVWWGLRSGADGREDGGFDDVVMVGGSHDPDLPVHENSGKMLARLVLDGTSIVLSPKGLVKASRRRLVGELLAELYDRANGTPILVVIDEADEYAPQGGQSYGNKRDDPLVLSLGAVEDIVRRGRAGGLGSLLITQRVAVLSKNVLEQSDTLIALGVTGKNDIDAVASWIAKHAPDVETGKRITASLPALPRGTAWVWSPEHEVLERVEVLPITTFDSSRSPKVGEVAVKPKGRKAIDLAALGEEMARFAAEVKADDPAELRKQITQLRRELAAMDARPQPDPVEVRVEVPVLMPEIVEQIEAALSPAAALLGEAQETLAKHRMWAEQQLVTPRHTTQLQRTSAPKKTTTQTPVTGRPSGPARPAAPRPAVTSPNERRPAGDGSLPGPQQRILDALAWWATVGITEPNRVQVAFVSGYSNQRSKGFVNPLGALNTSGYIRYVSGGSLALTDAGAELAQPPEFTPTPEGFQQTVLDQVGNVRARLLSQLIAVYPDSMARDELAERTGYTNPRSKGFVNPLGSLRTLGFLDYPDSGLVVATPVLFFETA